MIITAHGIVLITTEAGLGWDMDTIHGDSDIGDSTTIFMDIITEIGIILTTIIHYMVILIIKVIVVPILLI
jgi:hypothetical protein